MDEEDDSQAAVKTIKCGTHVFDAIFHPDASRGILASCHVSGLVAIRKLEADLQSYKIETKLRHHKTSCRAIEFFPSGESIASVSVDKTARVTTLSGSEVWTSQPSTSGLNAVRVISDAIIATGGDGGEVELWDIRTRNRPVKTFVEYEEFVSSISYDGDNRPNHLVTTAGDCLGIYDIRAGKYELDAMSDPLEADLSCSLITRSGAKVVCGDQLGIVCFFTWGDFGDMNDRMLGHGQTVEKIVPLENNYYLTAAGDGLVRLVSFFPNKVIGCLTMHDGGVEILNMSPDQKVVVAGSQDQSLHFHSTAPLFEMIRSQGGVMADEDAMGDGDEGMTGATTSVTKEGGNSFFSDL